MHDLGIEGGWLIGPHGRRRHNVYIDGERVVEVTPEQRPALITVPADGLLVMPGMVDLHVHLMDPAATDREDFPSGTAAAARAGVTTIVEHTHAGPVRTPDDLAAKRRHLADRSRVDYGLAAHAWPDRLDGVAALWSAGATFFKVFTCTTHGVPGFGTVALLELLQRARAAGALCLIHCEDEAITAEAERQLRAAGRLDPELLPEWRSREAEMVALASTGALAAATGARVITAHVSHPRALDVVAAARRLGGPIGIETCPSYLTLLESEVTAYGPLRKFAPPARARDAGDLDAMWKALASRRITHVATDHAPSTRSQKGDGDFWAAPFGLPGLDTTLAVLLDGASKKQLTYERIVEAYSTTPARLAGLYPRKGRIARGSDADVVLVDPRQRWTVRSGDILSKAGWSPFEGRTLTGRAVATFLRGRRIADERGFLAAPGIGRWLPGPGAA
jgi:dihydroorotase (multifunctional complex type)